MTNEDPRTPESPTQNSGELDFREFDGEDAPVEVYQIPFLIKGDWGLGFQWVTSVSFALWLGVTSQSFESALSFCTVVVTIGLILYILGKLSGDHTLAQRCKKLFHISGAFVVIVCISHFLSAKFWVHGFL